MCLITINENKISLIFKKKTLIDLFMNFSKTIDKITLITIYLPLAKLTLKKSSTNFVRCVFNFKNKENTFY